MRTHTHTLIKHTYTHAHIDTHTGLITVSDQKAWAKRDGGTGEKRRMMGRYWGRERGHCQPWERSAVGWWKYALRHFSPPPPHSAFHHIVVLQILDPLGQPGAPIRPWPRAPTRRRTPRRHPGRHSGPLQAPDPEGDVPGDTPGPYKPQTPRRHPGRHSGPLQAPDP